MALDMKRYENVLRKQTGRAVRPVRMDGYVNAINRYGTKKDDTEQYFYHPEPEVPDEILEMFYENNGLFAKIIDTPAEEAVKHGFSLEGVEDEDIIRFYESALDELDWEDIAMNGIKWARLFGGALAVMLINDGHGLEEPLDWKHIRSIDDIVIFDRSMITPDRTSLYRYDPEDPFRTRGSRLGTPEWYEITGPSGSFMVHDSRCLAFRNGILPFNTTNENYQLWGIPEYVRLNRAIRNAEIAHESAPKMLSKSVQPVYKMKDLAMELATEEGEDKVLRRLEAIDMARGLLNSITIDSEGEDYSFQTFAFNGVDQVIESSCNWLSALSSIPQTILFGRSPAGMNATGESDFENYYNFVERIQKRMLRPNLRYLLSVIFAAGKRTGEVEEIPEIKVDFNPLWSMSDTEEAQLDSMKLQNEMTRASIAQAYIEMQVIDPKEVRVELGKEDPLDPETMLDEMSEEELLESAPEGQAGAMGGEGGMGGMMEGGMPPMAQGGPEMPQDGAVPMSAQTEGGNYAEQGNSPETAPEATKLPQDMNPEEEPDHEDAEGETTSSDKLDWITANGTHIPLNKKGQAVGGPLRGSDFSEAKSGKESEKESAFTPKRSDYVTEYEDEYSGKIRLEDVPPEDQFYYWKQMNMDKLRELFKKENAEAKARGEKGISATDMVRREWYGFQTEKVSLDIRFIEDEYEADEILSKTISPSTFEGWFRAYDSNYKPRVVNGLIASPEARSAALSLMYKNYQNNGGELSFEEFLVTPIKMYRGGHGQKHIDDDVFSSYTFDRKVAEHFAYQFEGSRETGRVYEAEIRPIDTWGSVNTIGESEIMVPSWIAPNGNVDSTDDSQDPGGLVKRWADPDYQPPVGVLEDSSKKWLVRDVDAIMSFVPDSDTDSPEWLDDEIKRRIRSVGVIVVDKNGKILSGIRRGGDGESYGLLGGPGGHVEPHESLEDAAIRETYEEFGIVAKDLTFLSLGDYEEESGMIPAIFLCTDWAGSIHPIDREMEDIRFRTITEIQSHKLFGPFDSSLNILEDVLTNAEDSGIMELGEEREDGTSQGLVKAVIARAQAKGFESKSGQNNFELAVKYLEDHFITVDDIVSEFSQKDAEQKKRKEAGAQRKKAEQEKQKQKQQSSTQSKSASAPASASASKTVEKPTKFRRIGRSVFVPKDWRIKYEGSSIEVEMKRGEIKSVTSFAGYGSQKELMIESDLISSFGGKPGEWSHVAGKGKVSLKGKIYDADIHWFEHPTVGQVRWKAKMILPDKSGSGGGKH